MCIWSSHTVAGDINAPGSSGATDQGVESQKGPGSSSEGIEPPFVVGYREGGYKVRNDPVIS